MKKIIVGTLMLGMLVSTVGAKVAHAEGKSGNTDTTTTVTAGDLTIKDLTKSITFKDTEDKNLKINGEELSAVTDASITVEDLTGSFQGWNLQVKQTTSETQKWATGMTIGLKNVANVLNVENQLFSEQAGTEGVYDLVQNKTYKATLTVPKNVRADTYTTTMVWTLAQGPATK